MYTLLAGLPVDSKIMFTIILLGFGVEKQKMGIETDLVIRTSSDQVNHE